MDIIDDVNVESPFPILSVKLEPASPEHEDQSLEVSPPEERIAPIKSDERCFESASEEPMCLQEELSHIKDEVIVDDEIEIGPTVIQARVQSTEEVPEISEAEFVGNYCHGVQEDQFNVIECNSVTVIYGDSSEFPKHVNRSSISNICRYEETPEKPFSCNLCNYKATRKSNLTRHIRTHSGDKPFSCNLCNYKTTDKGNLTKHIRIHSGDKPFSCYFCNYKSIHKSCLTIHIRSHTRDKPFSCYLCNYKATQNFHLTRHIRTHTAEKPFSCYLCNYKAADNSNLTRHIRTHTAEKPFSCYLCNYKAADNSNLTRHVRTHTEYNQFSCDICNFKTSKKATIIAHIRIHTRSLIQAIRDKNKNTS